MRALRHILLGWILGLLTTYVCDPVLGFFVAVLVGFFIGVATMIVGIGLEYFYERKVNGTKYRAVDAGLDRTT